MHTLYKWEFSKIKNNLLTPLNAMSESEMMPSAWIPCSERLPEEGNQFTKYLISISWFDTFFEKGEWKSYTDVGHYNAFKKLWLNDNESLIEDDENTVVTAWQPLPEPFVK